MVGQREGLSPCLPVPHIVSGLLLWMMAGAGALTGPVSPTIFTWGAWTDSDANGMERTTTSGGRRRRLPHPRQRLLRTAPTRSNVTVTATVTVQGLLFRRLQDAVALTG